MPAPISMIPNIWRSMAPSLLHPPLWPFLRDTGVSRQATRAEHRVNGTDFTSYCLCITGNTVMHGKLYESYFNNIVDDMPLFHEAKLPERPTYVRRSELQMANSCCYIFSAFLPPLILSLSRRHELDQAGRDRALCLAACQSVARGHDFGLSRS